MQNRDRERPVYLVGSDEWKRLRIIWRIRQGIDPDKAIRPPFGVSFPEEQEEVCPTAGEILYQVQTALMTIADVLTFVHDALPVECREQKLDMTNNGAVEEFNAAAAGRCAALGGSVEEFKDQTVGGALMILNTWVRNCKNVL